MSRDTAMAPDTKREVIKFYVWLVSGAIGIGFWCANLATKITEVEKANIRQDAEIRAIQASYYESRDRLTRIETDMKYIASGIEEIKASLKQQREADSR